MASAEWFFSTLAQSSAAIIGFVLAFSAVLHQLERQQRERRTDILRDELIELEEKYVRIILRTKILFEAISSSTNDPKESLIEEYIGEFSREIGPRDPEEILEKMESDQNIEYPLSATIAVLLDDIHKLLTRIKPDPRPEKDYLLNLDEFQHMWRLCNQAEDLIYGEDYESRELFNELNVGWSKGEVSPRTAKIFGEIQNDTPIERESAVFEEMAIQTIIEWVNEEDEHLSVVGDGKNMRSIAIIISSLRREFAKAFSHRNNTLLDFDPIVSRQIVKTSGFLALTGVFIPLGLLLTIPQSSEIPAVSGLALTLIEASVLLLSAGCTVYLLYIILENLDGAWDGLNLLERIS